jgi:hypothetical protein
MERKDGLSKVFHYFILNLPFTIKKLIYPHEYDYYILKYLKKKKIKILDIGGGCGESIISFYNINKEITVDTYEPNNNNYQYCLKLKEKYEGLNVYNYAYGLNKKKNNLYIPVVNNYRLDNLSGFDKNLITENIKSNFKIKKINFLQQECRYATDNKNYDFIKIDCETNFFNTVKSLLNNLTPDTLIMIEFNYELKKIYSFLKKRNINYKCYYLKNKKYHILNNFKKQNKEKILNVIFCNNNFFKKRLKYL